MWRGSVGPWVMVSLLLMLALTLMDFGMSFAGVGGSDVPTVTGPVQVGGTYDWSFTITNTSTDPNDIHRVKVLANDGGIFFTTACGVPHASGKCPDDQREAPLTITIDTLSATGHAGTACGGTIFTVSPTGIPNEYRFEPLSDITLEPSSGGGLLAQCQVDFTVSINANPVHDSSGSPGLQTSQLARVGVLMDVETSETGSAAGTSTVKVLLKPTITTVPDPTEGKVGDSLKDKATLSEGWEPTGTITFKLFNVTDPGCSGSPIFTNTVAVDHGNGIYETSSGFPAPGPGTYHWTAEYSGDSNNLPASSRCSDEPVVIKCPTQIVTEPKPSNGKVGELLKDKATLSQGCSPIGTITFKLFNVTDPGCSGSPIFTNTVAVDNGNGIYETSSGFPAPGPGTYRWTAEYSGDPNNLPANSRCSDEPVVIKCPTQIVTEPNPSNGKVGELLKDKATLSEGCSPTGTITFKLFDVTDPGCSGSPIFTDPVSVNGNGIYQTSSGFPAPGPGTYHWTAEYSGDSNNLPANSRCSDEPVAIKCPPKIVTEPNPSNGKVGELLKDKATLSEGCTPTGTITFKLFNVTDPGCSGSPIFTNTVAVDHGNGIYETSSGYHPMAPGTYHWVAQYSGDVNNLSTSSACSDEAVVITCDPRIVTDPNPGAGKLGDPLKDKATLSGGCDPTGTITFKLFNVTDPGCSGSPIFTNTVAVDHGNGIYETSSGFPAPGPGTYHWTAEYSGDPNNLPVNSRCSDEPVVIKCPTQIVTEPNPSNGKVGELLKDKATLSEGCSPTGTITFKLFNVTDPGCSGSPIFTNTVAVDHGNGIYETSSGFPAPGPGTYHWTAEYSGDSNNLPASSRCSDEPVTIKCLTKIVTEPKPSEGKCGEKYRDTAILSEGCNPTGTITFKLFQEKGSECAGIEMSREWVSVNRGNNAYESPSKRINAPGIYHWVAEYSGDANNLPAMSVCEDETVLVTTPCVPDERCNPATCLGECPYVGIVDNDIDSNPFYFGCAYEQFLRDQTHFSVPVCWESFPPVTAQTRVGGAGCEQFRSNKPTDQPEVCDITGTIDKPGDYTYRGEPNAVITKQNSGYFEWYIRLPVKPAGEINLIFQCGVLKPNAFAFEGFDSVFVCAAETGERIGKGFCTHDQVSPNVNPIINSALPRITAIAYPGPYSPGFEPFHLTAYKNPGAYDLTRATGSAIMSNSASLYVLDGSSNARILLKSCMDKTIVTKIPVTGQRNAMGEFEHDLEAGDLIYVRMYIPGTNTVDIYCHSQSLRVSGIGEGGF